MKGTTGKELVLTLASIHVICYSHRSEFLQRPDHPREPNFELRESVPANRSQASTPSPLVLSKRHTAFNPGRCERLRGFSASQLRDSVCRAFDSEPNRFLSFSLWQLCHPQIALDLFEADDNPVRAYAECRVPGIVPWASVEVLDRKRIGDRLPSRRIQPHGPEARKPIPVRVEIEDLTVP